MSDTDEFLVNSLGFVRDEGTILVFKGWDDERQRWVAFGADHRVGRDLLDALEAWILGGRLDGEEPTAVVSGWQVLTTNGYGQVVTPPDPMVVEEYEAWDRDRRVT